MSIYRYFCFFVSLLNHELFLLKAVEKKHQSRRKLHAEKPTEAFKRFRDGDYPDIQINLDDILTPILQLALVCFLILFFFH